jgi:hypothetical protein
MSVCPVCPSAWNNSASTGRIFVKFYIWEFFENLSRQFKFSKPGVHRCLHFLIGTESATCLSRFKPFHPLIMTKGAPSILSQHTTVNFHRFHFFCPKKPHYATLFFDGALAKECPCSRPRCCHLIEGRVLYCKWRNSSTGIVKYRAICQPLSVPVTT